MIDVYSWTTPNGQKIHILLEELGLAYRIRPVDIGAGDQFQSDFLVISPNNKIPAIVDLEGIAGKPIKLAESGAILIYLAEKTGKLLPKEGEARYEVLKWLSFQMANVGPMLGQTHHFRHYAPEPFPYAIEHYGDETKRLYKVLDRRLSYADYLAGNFYSIADIATFPWIRLWDRQGIQLLDYPHLSRWLEAMQSRPAVQRGLALLVDRRRSDKLTPEERENLFGATQYRRRRTDRQV